MGRQDSSHPLFQKYPLSPALLWEVEKVHKSSATLLGLSSARHSLGLGFFIVKKRDMFDLKVSSRKPPSPKRRGEIFPNERTFPHLVAHVPK